MIRHIFSLSFCFQTNSDYQTHYQTHLNQTLHVLLIIIQRVIVSWPKKRHQIKLDATQCDAKFVTTNSNQSSTFFAKCRAPSNLRKLISKWCLNVVPRLSGFFIWRYRNEFTCNLKIQRSDTLEEEVKILPFLLLMSRWKK